MKQIAPNASSIESLQKIFWRWLSLSVLALALVAAAPAMSADVFIDEGDADFAPTPVTEGSKAPASETSTEASDVSNDLDSAIGELSPPVEEVSPPAGVSDESLTLDEPTTAPVVAEPAKPAVKAVEKTAVKKAAKKAAKKADKKVAKKSAKKDKKSAKKADKKSKKKDKKKTAGKKSKQRKVASNGKFAGGQYAVTSRACPMESAPGAGDVVGTTKVSKKLWVEESGNTSYWKVYGKAGNPAYISRDCF